MTDNLKPQIDAIFDRRTDQQKAAAAAAAEKVAKQLAFNQKFEEICSAVVVPAFEEFARALEGRDIQTKISIAPSDSPSVRGSRASIAFTPTPVKGSEHHNNTSEFTVYASPLTETFNVKELAFKQSGGSRSDDSSAHSQLGKLSKDWVHQKLVDFLREIIN